MERQNNSTPRINNIYEFELKPITNKKMFMNQNLKPILTRKINKLMNASIKQINE